MVARQPVRDPLFRGSGPIPGHKHRFRCKKERYQPETIGRSWWGLANPEPDAILRLCTLSHIYSRAIWAIVRAVAVWCLETRALFMPPAEKSCFPCDCCCPEGQNTRISTIPVRGAFPEFHEPVTRRGLVVRPGHPDTMHTAEQDHERQVDYF